MKITHYSKITLEGFQSAGKPLVFNLDNVGLNLIKGINGVGKTTIFNAIMWCEYGYNMKKSVATWEEYRTENFRGTRVVLERTDGDFDYMIARHLSFKGTTKGLSGGDKLMIFKKPADDPKFEDRHLMGDGLHKADMQQMIEEQLGMDSRTFLNSIIFGQKMASFVKTDNKDKRALFDQLFNVAFVDEARLSAKEEESRLNTSISTMDTKLDGFEEKKTALETKITEQQSVLDDFDTTKKARIKTAENARNDVAGKKSTVDTEVTNLKKEVAKYDLTKLEKINKELEKDKPSKKVLQADADAKSDEVDELNSEITKSKNKQTKLETDLKLVDTNCPSCLQSLPADKINATKKSISDQIKAEETIQKIHTAKLPAAEKALKDADAALKIVVDRIAVNEKEALKYSGDQTKATEASTNLKNKEARAAELVTELATSEKSLKDEKDAKKPKVDIDTTKEELVELEASIDATQDDRDEKQTRLTKVQWWITKGFGSSGLKAFVFNAMLAQLNAFTHKYASRLGFRIEFSIDTTKASKPFQTLIFKGDSVKDYEDLSGGQQQRVDIVVAFAMHDLISINSNINILVMDELFEGLDNEGVEAAFELIREKSDTKSVYLITHVDFIDTLNSRSVTFDLDEDSNTYIKN